jgi:tetratricopeptide (TPR) repeat protein
MAAAARNRQENHRVVALCERAGMLEDPPLVPLTEHRAVVIRLSAGLVERGRAEEALALIERLRAATSDPTELLEIEVDWGMVTMAQGGIEPNLDMDHWRQCAQRLGETRFGARARAIVGQVAKRRGDFDTARDAFLEAGRIYRQVGDDYGRNTALDMLASVAFRRGAYDEAIELYRESAELAESLGLKSTAAISRTNAVLAAMLSDRIEGAEADVERAARTFDADGALMRAAQSRLYLGELRFAVGKTEEALAGILELLPDLEKVNQRLVLANARRLAGMLLVVRDRADEGGALIDVAIADAEAGQDHAQLAAAWAGRALAHAVAGELEQAQDAGANAVAVGRRTKQPGGEVVLLLAEAAIFGLPTDLLEEAEDLPLDEYDRLLRVAAIQHDAAAAPTLRKAKTGLRGASYRLLAGWLEGTEEAREAAAAMGHLAALRVLGG